MNIELGAGKLPETVTINGQAYQRGDPSLMLFTLSIDEPPETVTINGQTYQRREPIEALFTPTSNYTLALNRIRAISHIAEQTGCTKEQAAWAILTLTDVSAVPYPSE